MKRTSLSGKRQAIKSMGYTAPSDNHCATGAPEPAPAAHLRGPLSARGTQSLDPGGAPGFGPRSGERWRGRPIHFFSENPALIATVQQATN